MKNEILSWILAVVSIAGLVAWTRVYFLRKKIKKIERQARDLSQNVAESAGASEREKSKVLAILESMTEGVIVTDTAGKITLLNGVLADLLGLDRRDAFGRYYWEIFRDPEINKTLEVALAEGTAIKKEHELLLSDRIYQIHISPVYLTKAFLGVTAVFYDVTKIKELEKTRAEFVANVSHELKTPLTSIIGFVETLKEGAIEDPGHRLKFLGIIDEHSQKLRALIEDLLSLSKLESGKDRLKTETVDLEKVLMKIENLLKRNLDQKKLKLELNLEARPFLIHADPLLIEQALMNLLDNAIKYNKPDGKISVQVSRSAQGVILRVKDTGIGIPAKDLTRIFERFYRVEKSRSRELGGTGLGLSIVKHIVEKHSGQIEVNSSEDRGTTFTITLPAH